MKIFRNSYDSIPSEDFNDGHGGYSYHPSRMEAVRAAKENSESIRDVAYEMNIPTSKKELIRWLNSFASHPDNG